MDRQRRTPAVSALGFARARFRSAAVLLSLGAALVAMAASGCRNRQEEARQRAELTQALQQYEAQVAELQKQTSGLRARFDQVPDDLPGLGTVRDDLHALEEGLGVENGRGKWLSGQLDKAFSSGKKEDIEAAKKAIPRGTEGFTQALVKVTHELIPFERLAGQRRFFEELDAANEREARKATR